MTSNQILINTRPGRFTSGWFLCVSFFQRSHHAFNAHFVKIESLVVESSGFTLLHYYIVCTRHRWQCSRFHQTPSYCGTVGTNTQHSTSMHIKVLMSVWSWHNDTIRGYKANAPKRHLIKISPQGSNWLMAVESRPLLCHKILSVPYHNNTLQGEVGAFSHVSCVIDLRPIRGQYLEGCGPMLVLDWLTGYFVAVRIVEK